MSWKCIQETSRPYIFLRWICYWICPRGTDNLFCKVTPWITALREKVTVPELITQFPASDGPRNLITMLRRCCHWTLSWVRWNHCIFAHLTDLIPNVVSLHPEISLYFCFPVMFSGAGCWVEYFFLFYSTAYLQSTLFFMEY